MTRGIVDGKHATELLKQHSGSKWHQDLSITATMAMHVELKCNVPVLLNKLKIKINKL